MACIFLISWSFWWSNIIVSGSSYSLSAGAMLSLDIQYVIQCEELPKKDSNLFEDILFRSMLVSPTAIPYRDKKITNNFLFRVNLSKIWKCSFHLCSQLSKACQTVVLIMDIVRHILQILDIQVLVSSIIFLTE